MLELLARPAGGAGHDGDARRVDRHRAADREVGIGGAHLSARHDEEFVHVRCTGDDGLGARDHDALAVALDDVHMGVEVGLLVRPPGAVALGVGHRDAERQVLVLHMGQVGRETGAVLGAASGVVDARTHLQQRVQAVVRQVALCTAGFLAQQAHGLELVEQVAGRLVDVQHAVDGLAALGLLRRHQRRHGRLVREVVAEGQRVDARLQARCIGHRVDALAIHVHRRPVAAQRFAVVGAGHQSAGGGRRARGSVHGSLLGGVRASFEHCSIHCSSV